MKHLAWLVLVIVLLSPTIQSTAAQVPPLPLAVRATDQIQAQALEVLPSNQVGAQAGPDLAFAALTPKPEDVRHVTPTGADGGSGTLEQPWSLDHAAKTLGPGQAAYVHAGEYRQRVQTVNPGERDRPIWLMAAPGEARPVLKGGSPGQPFIRVTKDYWIIDGLEVDATGTFTPGDRSNIDARWQPAIAFMGMRYGVARRINAHGDFGQVVIGISDATDVAVLESDIHDTSVWYKDGDRADTLGISVVGASERVLIRGNRSWTNAGDSFQCEWAEVERDGQKVTVMPTDLTIEGNEFRDDLENAIDIKNCSRVTVRANGMHGYRTTPPIGGNNSPGGAALVVHYNADAILFEQNRIWDSGMALTIGNGWNTGSVVFRRNLVFEATEAPSNWVVPGSSGAPPSAGAGILAQGAVARVEIYHNTFFRLPRSGLDLGSTWPIGRVLMANNIIAGISDTGQALAIWLPHAPTLASDHNLYSPARLRINVGDGTSITTLAEWQQWQGREYDIHSREGQPAFVSPPVSPPRDDDFKTLPTSPARDAAGLLTGYPVQPCSAGPDIGWLESCDGPPEPGTLEELVRDEIVPRFGPFAGPSADEQAAFRAAVRRMLDGECEGIALGTAIDEFYRVRLFTDNENGKSYCVLQEEVPQQEGGTALQRKGWGTFIVSRAPARELTIAIPHPLSDAQTEVEGVTIFKKTDSRSFLLAGSRRDALDTPSCQGAEYKESDVAHNTGNMFFAATQALHTWYTPPNPGGTLSPWTQLQFHGMEGGSAASSSLIHLSYGADSAPPVSDPGPLRRLQAALRGHHGGVQDEPTRVTVPGESGASGLNGTRNTQGRFLNKPDVPDDWCNLGATPATYSEKFLHIEQASDEGRPADKRIRDPEHWVRAIVAAWSTDPPPPPPIVVRGIAFADANGSGAREPGEAGLGGATVYLDANGNGRPDDGETTRAGTDAAGAYALRVGAGGPARLCISGLPAEFVPTTSRCQMVAGTAPTLDFGADRRLPGCTRGALSATIQSVALAGDPARYHRPTGLEGTARGPWAGTRLTIQPGGSNPVVAVMGGEGVATGLFVGGVDAAAVPNLVLRLRYQRSFQGVVAVVAADGTPAPIIGGGPGLPDPLPTTFAAWDRDGELYIFGVPADGAGGYQDVYVVTEITASRGYITANAGIAGTVRDGRIAALGNTCGDGADSRIERRQGGVRPDAVPADDIPDREGVTNPY